MLIAIEIFFSVVLSFGTIILINKYYFNTFKIKLKKTFLIVPTLSVPYYFIINAIHQSPFYGDINFGNDFSNLPNYLVFFATLISAILLYSTLKSQQKANRIAAFENRFFKFIDYHRENVNELLYRKPQRKKEEYYKGNQVFTVIYYEVKELLEEYLLNKYKGKEVSKEEKIEAINFTYHCIFYGAGKHSESTLASKFSKDYFEFINFKKKKAAYYFDGKKHCYYTGHVRRLGHYFRNIYQAVTYVDEQHFLKPSEKYEYMTIFRAQMSVYEQAVFFFNSVSDLGKRWELQEYQKDISEIDKDEIYPELYITKYDLIRNTLFEDGKMADNVFIKEFYPLINLERTEECAQYAVLPFKNNDEYICRFCFNENYIKYGNKKVERKITEALKFSPQQFDNFRCDMKHCKTTQILKSKEVR